MGARVQSSTGMVIGEKELSFTILHPSGSSFAMNIATGHDIFITSTPGNYRHEAPSKRTSRSDNANETARRGDQSSNPQVLGDTSTEFTELQTVKRVLQVLKEGRMDVVGFLDALCWGNSLAITDPTTRSARTGLTHSEKLAGVVSNWLNPPRTSQGGSTAEGARRTLLPIIIDTVKEIINREMDAVVEELKEESAEVTEQSVLGAMVDEVLEKVRVAAPVFYALVWRAAWSEKQEGRNTLKDPTKVSMCCKSLSVAMIHSNEPSACLVYHLPGGVFAKPPRQ